MVIGAGPNGLVAANLLADAGWDTVVVEGQDQPGGAVRTAELTVPGFHHDMFSAFYPLAAASPVIAALNLEAHGLEWLRAPVTLAHPTADGRCAVIGPDIDASADSVEAYAPGDGEGWRRLMRPWERVGPAFVDALLTPFPPVRSTARLAARAGRRGLLDLARLAVLPARRMGEEHFDGPGGRLLVAGNALHSDLPPEAAGSGLFGWLLCAMAQHVGFPVPRGGAGSLTASLVRRFEAAGGQVRLGQPVTQVIVRGGRAVGVRTAAGEEITAGRAVLADVSAPALYRRLLDPGSLPPGLLADLGRFQWDQGTVKVDWALSGPIPWTAPAAWRAGTVHVADSVDHLTRWAADLATDTVPERPFLLLGQQSMTDPSRQPPGAETAWAYTHVPREIRADAAGRVRGVWDGADTDAMVDRVEAAVEVLAPGFRDRIIGRHTLTPPSLVGHDANLDGGAINGGTAQLYQQLVFRPTVGLSRPETFVDGLYLASSAVHPGGGVHGSCGANAAHAALSSATVRRLWRMAQGAVQAGRPLDAPT